MIFEKRELKYLKPVRYNKQMIKTNSNFGKKKSQKNFLKTDEKKVLQELRNNSRQSFANISKKTNINKTRVFRTHKSFKKKLRLVSLIDFQKLNYKIRTSMIFKDKHKTLEILKNSRFTNNIQRLDNDTLMTELLFKNLSEKYDFLEQNNLDIVKEYEVIKDLKREGFNLAT
jgi:DNA-binding Lrp family transcriptional regulator